jgi:hypothetical protein
MRASLRLVVLPMMLAASIALGGCVTDSVLVGGTSLTATVANPVGRKEMAAVESGYRVAVVAAVNYRRYCYPNNVAVQPPPAGCSNRRAVVLALQDADRKARAAIVPLREFQRDNESVSAVSALLAARRALGEFQTALATNGVK